MSRITKTLGFSVPPALAREVENLAKRERRTKSELFREMVRVYRRYSQQRDRDEDRWIANLIVEENAGKAQNAPSIEEMLQESDRLVRYGEKRAKQLGIKRKDIDRIIHEHRQAQRA